MSRQTEWIAEQTVCRMLFEEAAKHGYYCARFACTPATGEEDDEVISNEQGVTLEQAFEHAKAWDSDSVAEFKSGSGYFWVLLVWGNGADLISDYSVTPDADAICNTVQDRVDAL